jgi:hypothetical protein
MILMISYDLNGHERPSAYQRVKAAIEGCAISARRPLYSQWLVETNESPAVWHQRLIGAIDSNDMLFTCEVTDSAQGWLPRETWEWLNARTRTGVR